MADYVNTGKGPIFLPGAEAATPVGGECEISDDMAKIPSVAGHIAAGDFTKATKKTKSASQ